MTPGTPAPPDSWIESPVTPGPPDLIPGLLPRRSALLITGETEVGKTLVGLEIAHSVITGVPLWGKVQPTGQVARVTYILGEHHEDTLRLLWHKMGLEVPARTLRLVGPRSRHAIVARGELMRRNAATYQEWCADSELVIFDPLSAFAAGVDAENDASTMRTCINGMEDVAGACNASLVILAHMGKPRFDQREGTYKQRGSYASRGSSSIEDAVTSCFYMKEGRGEAGIVFRLERRKYKGDAPKIYLLKRDDTTLRQTLVGGGIPPSQLAVIRGESGRLGGRPKTKPDRVLSSVLVSDPQKCE